MAFNVPINGYEASQFPTSLPHSIDEPLAVIAQVHTYRSPVKQVRDGQKTLTRHPVLLLTLMPCFPGARRDSTPVDEPWQLSWRRRNSRVKEGCGVTNHLPLDVASVHDVAMVTAEKCTDARREAPRVSLDEDIWPETHCQQDVSVVPKVADVHREFARALRVLHIIMTPMPSRVLPRKLRATNQSAEHGILRQEQYVAPEGPHVEPHEHVAGFMHDFWPGAHVLNRGRAMTRPKKTGRPPPPWNADERAD